MKLEFLPEQAQLENALKNESSEVSDILNDLEMEKSNEVYALPNIKKGISSQSVKAKIRDRRNLSSYEGTPDELGTTNALRTDLLLRVEKEDQDYLNESVVLNEEQEKFESNPESVITRLRSIFVDKDTNDFSFINSSFRRIGNYSDTNQENQFTKAELSEELLQTQDPVEKLQIARKLGYLTSLETLLQWLDVEECNDLSECCAEIIRGYENGYTTTFEVSTWDSDAYSYSKQLNTVALDDKKSLNRLGRKLSLEVEKFIMDGTLSQKVLMRAAYLRKNTPKEKRGAHPIEDILLIEKEVPNAKEFVFKTYPDLIENGEVESKIIETLSDWAVKASHYNNSSRSEESPNISYDEAIAWTRLDGPAQAQFKGMRQKIGGINLSNIQRFIGHTGVTKYQKRKYALEQAINSADVEEIKATILQNINATKGLSPQEKDARLEEVDTQENIDEVIEIAKRELTELEPKVKRHMPVGERAISLFFEDQKLFGRNFTNGIDWINEAKFGMINRCSRMLERGVSPIAALSYAYASNIFPEREIDTILIKRVQSLISPVPENTISPNEIIKSFDSIGISITESELLAFPHKTNQIEWANYQRLIEAGMEREDIVNNGWILHEFNRDLVDKFPISGNRTQIVNFCLENAFYLPNSFPKGKLGSIILRRLEQGIDRTLHDATFWLSTFNTPDSSHDNEIVYKDSEAETILLFSALTIENEKRFRLPKKEGRIDELFSDPLKAYVYKKLVGQDSIQSPIESLTELKHVLTGDDEIAVLSKNVYSAKLQGTPTIKEQLLKIFDDLENRLNSDVNTDDVLATKSELEESNSQDGEKNKDITQILQDLKEISVSRKSYEQEAFHWLETNSVATRNKLAQAWQIRPKALAEGTLDTPNAILAWMKSQTFMPVFYELQSNGKISKELSYDEFIQDQTSFLNEVNRCYNPYSTLETLNRYRKTSNPDFDIYPTKIDIGDGITFEIFPKNDPRGFTIGYDTGCCMTIGGISQSCIWAGYEKPSYGFLGIYRKDRLIAQSFLYCNPNQPETIVCDNIETNSGRDMAGLIENYKKGFEKYFDEQSRRNYASSFSTVNIGAGYSKVGLQGLKAGVYTTMPNTGIYTDASYQKELLHYQSNQQAREAIDVTELNPDEVYNYLANQLEITDNNQRTSRFHLRKELAQKDTVAFELLDSGEFKGFCSGYLSDEENEEGKAEKTITVTSVMAKYDDDETINDLLYLLQRRGFELGAKAVQWKEKRLQTIGPSRKETMKGKVNEKSEVIYSQLTDASQIVDLESRIYQEDAKQGEDFWNDVVAKQQELSEEAPLAAQLSIIAQKNNADIGYVSALPEESEFVTGEVALHIQDLAILPEARGGEIVSKFILHIIALAKEMLTQDDMRSELNYKGSIEFEARQSTSYKLLMTRRAQALLLRNGYIVSEDRLLPAYLGNEDYHLIRLVPVDVEVIA